MGRKTLWKPTSVKQADVQRADALLGEGESDTITVIRNWFLFLRLNVRVLAGRSRMMALYIAQQLRKGVMRSTVKGRLEILKNVPCSTDPAVEEALVERIKCRRLVSSFSKGAQSGKIFKENLPVNVLLLPLQPPARKRRDREYQSLWWALLTTGARPTHIREALLNPLTAGLAVTWAGGRKSEDNALSRPLLYRYEWVAGPPTSLILAHLEECKKIGTQNRRTMQWNTAACVNAWLKKWMELHHPAAEKIISTLPRVHLDNTLRVLVHGGALQVPEFEVLMDHSIKTSNEHYCSTLLQ